MRTTTMVLWASILAIAPVTAKSDNVAIENARIVSSSEDMSAMLYRIEYVIRNNSDKAITRLSVFVTGRDTRGYIIERDIDLPIYGGTLPLAADDALVMHTFFRSYKLDAPLTSVDVQVNEIQFATE